MLYVTLISALVYGSLIYLLARWGYLKRLAAHRSATDAELVALQSRAIPSVTILVPSYKEDSRVVRKTLLSAALQDYPARMVVLLIDDPPIPTTPEDRIALDEVRKIPAEVERLLAPLHRRLARAARLFERRTRLHDPALAGEGRRLAALLREVRAWFAEQADRYAIADHSDRLFIELTFRSEQHKYEQRAEALLHQVATQSLDLQTLRHEYDQLARRFAVTVRSFERKCYANLSHEPNKAMNLNSYIGLMGRGFRERIEGAYRLLEPAPLRDATITIPDSEYVVVLDADSLLHPEYALRLACCLGQPEHRRVAVIQTPYSAFPGAVDVVERVAGATTDIQYMLHQGFTHYRATSWVGANAMVRKEALSEIAETRQERGFTVRTFIHDRTVIEDTESTIELRDRGWQLYNYPERLAFSATPPDFGSLLIQRRRWANGGLLIVPKLWRCLWRDAGRRISMSEAFFRLHYLASLAVANVALLILLACAFDDQFASVWLPITAIPYYLLYATDLRRAGYRARDVLHVYALNLLLIPVNLAGVLRSLQQAWTGHRSAFGRTPKVLHRTTAPAGYVAAEIGLLLWWTFGSLMELYHGRILNGAFALGNAGFLLYAVARFIGLRAAREDLRPLAAPVRVRWSRLRVALSVGSRRLVTPAALLLALLLAPGPAAGVELAVTIDDLPTHGPLPPGTTRATVADHLVHTLKQHGVPGVIGFVNGGQLEADPTHEAILTRWLAAGYELGNHTFSHADLNRSDPQQYLAEIDRNETVITRYAGASAERTFRYPYLHEGDTLAKRRAVRVALQARGYEIAQPTVDFYDWAWNDAYARCLRHGSAADIAALRRSFLESAVRALDWSQGAAHTLVHRPIKHILLLHVGAFDALMLEPLLTAYERRGVRFISVREAMTDPIYGINPDVTWPHQQNFLEQLLQATGQRSALQHARRLARALAVRCD